MPWLINAAQLDKFRKTQKSLIILDASFHHGERNAKQEFLEKHIIDAHFFDIDLLSDTHTDHPHRVILDEKRISELISSLGIRNDYKIIFYDNSELHTACRALWMFKLFGHNPNLLYILDGGFKAWEKFGGKTVTGQPSISPKSYTARIHPIFIRTLAQIKSNLKNPTEQIVDVRHAVRYGSGHIPGSFCCPMSILFDKEGCFSPLEKIRRKLVAMGIDLRVPVITSCGSGMTAPVLNFLLDLMNHSQHALYNGSWTEWSRPQLYDGEISLLERPIESCV